MTAKQTGIALLFVFAIAAGIAVAAFPWHTGDHVSSTYIVAIAVSGVALVWGLAMFTKRWRWLAISFAAVTTVYAGGLTYVFIHVLPK
jgi:hypothetical protein